MTEETLRVFVYGTLKQGEANHARHCPGCLGVRPAVAPGRLVEHPAGYPALRPWPGQVLAVGASDPAADLEAQRRLSDQAARALPAAPLVLGQILAFPSPAILPELDDLEDFRPGLPSLYLRVLAPAWPVGGAPRPESPALACWMYVEPPT